MKSIYEIRKAGREYCQTEGSEHYKGIGIEPAEISIANGMAEDWILTNIVKYALRFKQTQDLKDLVKISDYAHVLCGVKLADIHELKIPESKVKPGDCMKVQNGCGISYSDFSKEG